MLCAVRRRHVVLSVAYFFTVSWIYMGKNEFCCAPHCSNNRKRNPDIQFYRIPKESKRRKAWLDRICRDKKFVPLDNTRICSQHFSPSPEWVLIPILREQLRQLLFGSSSIEVFKKALRTKPIGSFHVEIRVWTTPTRASRRSLYCHSV